MECVRYPQVDHSSSHDNVYGIFVAAASSGNLLTENKLTGNVFDAWDESSGSGTAGTANRWKHNKGQTSFPAGLFG